MEVWGTRHVETPGRSGSATRGLPARGVREVVDHGEFTWPTDLHPCFTEALLAPGTDDPILSVPAVPCAVTVLTALTAQSAGAVNAQLSGGQGGQTLRPDLPRAHDAAPVSAIYRPLGGRLQVRYPSFRAGE